jgi:hypothetical protein
MDLTGQHRQTNILQSVNAFKALVNAPHLDSIFVIAHICPTPDPASWKHLSRKTTRVRLFCLHPAYKIIIGAVIVFNLLSGSKIIFYVPLPHTRRDLAEPIRFFCTGSIDRKYPRTIESKVCSNDGMK